MKTFIKQYPKSVAIVAAMAVGYLLGFISIYYFEEYGWTVFVLIPLLLGLLPAWIYGSLKEMTINQAFKIGFTTLGIFCLSTLVFALEGIICIVMASPILAFFTFLGCAIGYNLVGVKPINSQNAMPLIILPALFLVADVAIDSTEYLEVKTSITIEAPAEKVWDNIIGFGQIAEPEEWFFKTGISYPTHAEIKGSGVGAIRYCNFTTGSFVEPITTWNEPNLLQFDVQDQPTPMRELNPFWDVHPPHLDGYFQSKKGQFKLTTLEDGSTRVEGTTWYNIHIHPVQYWDFWSKFILHRIHYRVLNHIKLESEGIDS